LPDETNQTPAGKSIDQYPVSGVIAEAFAGCLWNRTEWSGKLKDPGKRGWLVDARQAKSGAGTEGSRWNPIMIAVALNEGVQKRLTDSEKQRPEPGDRAQFGTRRVRKARLARVFEHTGLRDWASDWANTEDLLDD
jgi:hypothetical protein